MNKKIIMVKGEEFEVVAEVFGECPKCNADTFGENENVYGSDPYAMEVCPSCGWWANSVMNSDDMEEEEVYEEVGENYEESVVDRFTNSFGQIYARMIHEMYGIEVDIENDEDIPNNEHLMREAFYKACYDYKAVTKAFSVEEAYMSSKVEVINMNMLAILPEDDGITMGVFDATITDVVEL